MLLMRPHPLTVTDCLATTWFIVATPSTTNWVSVATPSTRIDWVTTMSLTLPVPRAVTVVPSNRFSVTVPLIVS